MFYADFQLTLILTYQQALDPLMFVACLKVLSLEDQNWLHILANMLGSLKFST